MIAALLASIAVAAAPAVAPGPSAAPAATPRLFPVLKGGKWGFIDRTGAVAIAPRFDEAGPFSEGLAAVRLGATLGYVDARGELALVPKHGPGKGLLPRRFSSGRALVRVGEKLGYIDTKGALAIPPRFDAADDFSDGLAVACDRQAGCGYIDAAGRGVIGPGFMSGRPARNGIVPVLLAMSMGRERVQLYSARTRQRVGAVLEGAGVLSDGLVPVRLDGLWGAVDEEGRAVIPPRFDWLGDFAGGLAPARPEARGPCGYVDRGGAFVVPPRFRSCRPFSGGLARVDVAEHELDEERVAFVDRTGTVRIRGAELSPPFDAAGDFEDGLAAVGCGGDPHLAGNGVLLGYVDPTGRYVWQPQE